ncbi:MAG: twin-arginine translocase TatA/TatE family subunit [Planctomycetota bacterium]
MNLGFATFFAIGTWEWAIIAGIAVLLFGSTKLPKLAKSVGQSVVEFKKGIRSGEDEEDEKAKKLPRDED